MSVEDCRAFLTAFKEANNVPRANLVTQFSIIAELDDHPVCIHGRVTSGGPTARMNIYPKDNRYLNVFDDLVSQGVDVTGSTKGGNHEAEVKFVAV